ncbi:MAG: right-handed parallel beta-helix repeat-containing protein, partial [Proteobacteria bacterium]|nr:right-handed parallel beta-helix repeat-containing protein [Pseudomonadota bacterium]
FFSKHKPLPLLRIKASGVVLDGLFIEGFERDSKKKEIIELNRKGIKGVYQFPVTRGIDIEAANTTIKNCEIAGFSHAAIFMLEGSSAVIESNSIHHNQRWGLGYGVALHQRSTALIKGNRFDYNRHSIAGSGFSGQSYEAEANEFGVHHSDSPLDMHGGKDRSDGTSIAGKRVEIHHNVVLYSGQPVFIHRGIAEDFVSIHDNEIHHPKPDQAIGYFNGVTRANLPAGKFRYYKNRFK